MKTVLNGRRMLTIATLQVVTHFYCKIAPSSIERNTNAKVRFNWGPESPNRWKRHMDHQRVGQQPGPDRHSSNPPEKRRMLTTSPKTGAAAAWRCELVKSRVTIPHPKMALSCSSLIQTLDVNCQC